MDLLDHIIEKLFNLLGRAKKTRFMPRFWFWFFGFGCGIFAFVEPYPLPKTFEFASLS